MSTLSWL